MKKVTVSGNVGCNPIQDIDRNGNRFVSFNVAIKRYNSTRPEWVYVSCYGAEAEYALANVYQGIKVLVEGSPKINTHTNKHGIMYNNQLIFADYLSIEYN